MANSSADNGGEGAGADDVPFYLMPLAATLGMYTLVASIKAILLIYRNVTYNPKEKTSSKYSTTPPTTSIKSPTFLLLCLSIVVTTLGYAHVVARVNNVMDQASMKLFDPYEILDVEQGSANSTLIKKAYRRLSLLHHPDKGGDKDFFQQINLAYMALTDETSMKNYELYGHPDGPKSSTLAFALPEWLLRPKGNTAVVLIILYFGLFAYLIKYVIAFFKASEENARKAKALLDANVVDRGDIDYMMKVLKDDSSHLEILYCVATAPESLALTRESLRKIDEKRKEKLEALDAKKKLEYEDKKQKDSSSKSAFDLDDGGWADDDDEEMDEDAKKAEELAREAEREKERAARELAASTGKIPKEDVLKLKFEGIDEGVLGQKWVEGELGKFRVWPPSEDILDKVKAAVRDEGNIGTRFDGGGGSSGKDAVPADIHVHVDPEKILDDPAFRRNMLFTTGRLNSILLNTHPDLAAANANGTIDGSYFRQSMEFRQRTGLLLDAALRAAVLAKRYSLVKTMIESVAMFKIGTNSATKEKNLKWFADIMEKQYGGKEGFPRLEVKEKTIQTPGEEDIATGDKSALTMTIERTHAQKFLESKIEMCKKQRMDPRLALQTYNEGWWFLVRAQRVGVLPGGEDEDNFEPEEPKLVVGMPLIVRNVAQKVGKIRCQFDAPDEPGKYKFTIDLKSQDFLGADQLLEIDVDILDQEEVKRKEEEEEIDEDGDDEDDEDEKGGDDEDEEQEEVKKDQ